MSGGIFGGGVIFVVAAVLWAAVLVPAWLRRREFRAAERNAIRLQRTLRVLAETTELPEEMHLEATAKEALAHEKLLRTAQRKQAAERNAELAEAKADQLRAELHEQQMRQKQAAVQRQARLKKPVVRRIRAIASLGAALGLLGALVGIGVLIAGSGAAVLVCAGAVFAASLGALVLYAPGRGRAHYAQPVQVPVEEIVAEEAEPEEFEEPAQQAPSRAAHEAAQRVAAQRIARAQALARARARAAHLPERENQPDSMLLREGRAAEDSGAGSGASRAASGQQAQASAQQGGVAASGVATGTGAAAAEQLAANRTQGAPSRQGSSAAAQRPAARRVPPSAAEMQQQAMRERLSRMGVVGDSADGMPDLDELLKRRRNAG